MLGIVLDVDKLIQKSVDPYKEQIAYLKEQLNKQQEHLDCLNEMILMRAGLLHGESRMETAVTLPVTSKVRTWKDKKAILEKKFRPPELAEREERWKKEAENASKEIEVEENAS
ncbi:MAG: hypothetical protein WAV13_04640 [Thermodesulfovibrionales bacterium]